MATIANLGHQFCHISDSIPRYEEPWPGVTHIQLDVDSNELNFRENIDLNEFSLLNQYSYVFNVLAFAALYNNRGAEGSPVLVFIFLNKIQLTYIHV